MAVFLRSPSSTYPRTSCVSCGRSSSSRTAAILLDTASTEVREMSSLVRRSLTAALVFSMANGSAPLASWLLSSAHFFS